MTSRARSHIEAGRAIRMAPFVVLLTYAGSRAALAAQGVRFNAEALEWYWQVLDPRLLRERLWESLLYLHSQPPLFNLILGLAYRLPDPEATLRTTWWALGACLVLAIYHALRSTGASEWFAGAASVALSLSLPWVAYESWLFYDFPCAALLAMGALCLFLAGRSQNQKWLLLFYGIVAGLVLMRSLFHLLWLFAALAIAVVCTRPPRRRTILLGTLPLVLVVGLYAKNAVLFGFFGASSWSGMSLAKMTSAKLDRSEREEMIRGGDLSRFAAVAPFSRLEQYEDAAGTRFDDVGVPAVSRRVKPGGHSNFNHLAFVEISAASQHDALTALSTHPGIYLRSVHAAVNRFFSSTVSYPPFLNTITTLGPWSRLYQATFGSSLVSTITFIAALIVAVGGTRHGFAHGDPGLAASALWVVLNLGWTLVFGSLVELGENHRFRFYVSPLIWMTLLAGASLWWRNRRGLPSKAAH